MTDDYLYDPAARASPDVEAMERLLAPFAYPAPPLRLPAARRTHFVRSRWLLAAAAGLILIAGAARTYWTWRWTWPAGEPWPVRIVSSQGSAPSTRALGIAQPLQLAPQSSADVDIARIGSMHVAPGSELSLTETRSNAHRVVLDRGSVSVRVWAPPGRLSFRTPAGEVMDLGCVFDLSVDATETARVRVLTGWVQMANTFGESLLPAGTSSRMTLFTRPGVPVYDDAPPELAAAIRAFEAAADPSSAAARLEAALPLARRRDVLTLLMLGRIARRDVARELFARAAALMPPPPGVSLTSVVDGNRDQLWAWYATLDLPPVKGWWRNWRDALPRFNWID